MCGGLPALVRIAWGWYNIVSTRWVCCSGLGVQFWCAVCAGFRVGFVCCVYRCRLLVAGVFCCGGGCEQWCGWIWPFLVYLMLWCDASG